MYIQSYLMKEKIKSFKVVYKNMRCRRTYVSDKFLKKKELLIKQSKDHKK